MLMEQRQAGSFTARMCIANVMRMDAPQPPPAAFILGLYDEPGGGHPHALMMMKASACSDESRIASR